MHRLVRSAICTAALLAATGAVARAQELRFAEIGDFTLESGEVIRDCRVGYRTFGALAADRSNVVVVLTWANGKSEQMVAGIESGRPYDLSRYYVVVIDALGNGVSSSPSNSKLQPRMRFPKFTVRDMVASQHEALTKVLHIDHVRAVVGVSMGGMQTFEWMVAYPDFMDRAIPIVGSPRLAPYDLVVWQAQIDAIENDARWHDGNYTTNPGREAEVEFGALVLTTPEAYNRSTTREETLAKLEKASEAPAPDANDKIRQAEAMMALDVAKPFGGSLERAAAAVKAKVLVVVSRTDHTVTPGPALEFARLLRAETIELASDCGHMGPSCESERVDGAVARFLAE
jgi:homoserine O-acetyltransferase